MDDIFPFVSWGVLLVLLSVNYLLFRDFKCSSVLHAGLWFLVLTFHIFFRHGLYELSQETLLIVVFSVFAFSVGGGLGAALIPVRSNSSKYSIGSYELLVSKIYFLIALLGAPLFWFKAIELASHGVTDSFMVNLRISLTHDDYNGTYGALSYLLPVAYSSFFILLLDKSRRIFSFFGFLCFVICVYYAVLSTGRTFLFLFFIPVFSVVAFVRRDFLTVKNIFIIFISLIVSFLGLGYVMGKLGEGVGGVVSTFWIYFLSGISAFDVALNDNSGLGYGENSFRTLYAILFAFGFDVSVKDLIRDYVYVPVPTNVYTVFHPYFVDFGLWFVFFCQFSFGLLHMIFYRFAVGGNAKFILIYSLSLYPLAMQFFQDQYLSLLSMWVVYGTLLLLPFCVARVFDNSKGSVPEVGK